MRQNNKRAFTLVEVLIVIVIIGILFIVLMANVDFSTDEAKETGTKAIMQSYKLAAETIALENSGFTNDKAELVKLLNKRLDLELQFYVEGSEIKSKQTDAWGKEFKFVQSTPVNTYGMFAIQSAGPDGIFDNGDDIVMENKYVVVNGVGQVVTEFPEIDPNHSHSYVLRVTDPLFLKSPATCQSAAVYYYSCECGKMNGTDFTFGVADPDAHGTIVKEQVKKVPVDYATHQTVSKCSLCNVVLGTVENPHRPDATGEHCLDCNEQLHIHIYDKEIEANQYKKNDANCTEPLTYFKSCECGAASPDETFTKGTALGHNYTKETLTYKASDANCRDYATYFLVCQGCDGKGTAVYNYIAGGKNPARHVGGTRIEYERVDDSRHIKNTICNGCGDTISSVNESHNADGECCHTHSYTKTVEAAAYEKTPLTCTANAVYYKSCECGKSSKNTASEATFTGSATPKHLPATTATWDTNHTTATVKCTRSGCSKTWVSTSSNEVTTTQGTCITERQYKHKATVNVDGTTKTFECSGHTGTKNMSVHLYSISSPNPAAESVCKWYPCCETVTDAEHNWNVSAATCSVDKKCSDCGYIAEKATGCYGDIVFAKTANVCQKYSGCGCTVSTHIFGSAACESPSTCTRTGCGYYTGTATGHSVKLTDETWSSDHTTITFYCANAGCTKTWEKSTTEVVTTTANCVTAKKWKHTLTYEGKTFECSGHTGSVSSSTHAADCVWQPVSSPTSSLCQTRSRCGAKDTSHDYNVTSITCGSSVEKKYCTTCNYLAQNKPAHTPVYGGTSSVHRKCSVCSTTLEGSTYHNYTLSSGGSTCTETATYKCICGASYTSTSSHNWETVQADTCTEVGSRRCTKCGTVETVNDITDHNFPTSGTPSWNGCNPYYTCRNSGCTATNSLTKSKNVTTSANCITYEKYNHKTTQGGVTYTCGTTHVGEKAPNTHASSCTLAWKGVQNICQYRTGCGIVTKDYDDHVWNVTSVTPGGVDKKCVNCGYIDEYAPSCSHNMVATNNINGNCKVCSICGYYTTHSWSTATCTTKSTCSGCGLQKGDYAAHTKTTGGSITTYPSCTTAGYRYYKCSVCGTNLTPAYKYAEQTDHTYDNNCDTTCNVCGATRAASHTWNRTSATCQFAKVCSVCGAVGEAKKSHSLNASWDHDCNLTVTCSAGCGGRWTDQGDHSTITASNCTTKETYDHVASVTIDGSTRTYRCGTTHTGSTSNSHSYSVATCYKAATCSRCGATTGLPTGNHSYTNACDKTCNRTGCSATRTIPTSSHVYTNNCDKACNNSGCTYTRTISTSSHVYTNNCDTSCNNSGCTYTRSITHNYQWAVAPNYGYYYHMKTCTVCGVTTGSSESHDKSYSSDGASGHTITCTICPYRDTGSHYFPYGTVTGVTAYKLFSGNNDHHDATYHCQYCSYSKTVTSEACIWNSDNDCYVCGQNKG